MMTKKFFYCYSTNLSLFLKSMGFRYITTGHNKNSNCKYYMYKKSNELDCAIEVWNTIKYKLNKEMKTDEL